MHKNKNIFKVDSTKLYYTIFPIRVMAILIFLFSVNITIAQTGNHFEHMEFKPFEEYKQLDTTNPEVYKQEPGAYINTGPNTSPALFVGGQPLPMTVMGTFGPSKLYRWVDYIKSGNNAEEIAKIHNIFGLPNGIAMIHWKQNNLSEKINNTYTVEMVTGWGSFAPKILPNDFGWINGTVPKLLDDKQADFIHIYFRKMGNKNSNGTRESTLYFWELLINRNKEYNEAKLYEQLKNHINRYWGIINGKTFPNYKDNTAPEPLASNLHAVFFLMAPSNEQIPSIEPKYWSKNTAYPQDNYQ
jgi:hypothetical protein